MKVPFLRPDDICKVIKAHNPHALNLRVRIITYAGIRETIDGEHHCCWEVELLEPLLNRNTGRYYPIGTLQTIPEDWMLLSEEAQS